jgi:glutathione S-transferase
MTDLTLVYMKMRALGEAPQMLMHYAGLPYSYRMAWDYFGMPWPEAKPQVPFRQLPMLVVDDVHQIAQSGSIMRFLAAHAGMTLADPVKAAQVDSIFEATQELFAPLNPTVNFAVGDDFQTKRTAILGMLGPRMGDFDRIIEGSGEPFLTGDAPTYCDFGLFHHLDLAHLLDARLLAKLPRLSAFMEAMRSVKGMQDYLQGRPELIEVGVKPQLVIGGKAVATGMMAD